MNLPNYLIVTYALAELDGNIKFVDSEDIAILANELAPGKFNWKKYPENIDLNAVRDSLRDAKRPKNGTLVTGNNSTGWMVTSDGVAKLNELDVAAQLEDVNYVNRKGSVESQRELERKRLLTTVAYQLYEDGQLDQITLQDFYHFVRFNEYFQSKARQRRINIIENAIHHHSSLSELWELLKQKFHEEVD